MNLPYGRTPRKMRKRKQEESTSLPSRAEFINNIFRIDQLCNNERKLKNYFLELKPKFLDCYVESELKDNQSIGNLFAHRNTSKLVHTGLYDKFFERPDVAALNMRWL